MRAKDTIIALTILTAAISVFMVRTVIPAAETPSGGFLAYYVGAQTIKNGEPVVRLYDEEWFDARVQEVSRGQVHDVYLVNPPVLAVAWLPFAFLPVETARSLWIGLSVLWLALAIALIAGQLASSRRLLAIAGITALFTLSAPVREQFSLGQMYAFILLLHTIGWKAYSQRQDARAGVALGLAMVLKLSGWPIAVLMIAQRRWIAVRWSIITAVLAAIATLPWVGIDAWRTLLSQRYRIRCDGLPRH